MEVRKAEDGRIEETSLGLCTWAHETSVLSRMPEKSSLVYSLQIKKKSFQ